MLMRMSELDDRPADAPALFLYLTDIPRAGVEYGQLLSVLPLQRVLPTGDGHPVLVLPGLLAGDGSTWILRRILRRLGYRAYGWGLGRNIGPTPHAVDGMIELLNQLYTRHNAPVSLIGWSLGGIFARNLARNHPSAVRQVITLGSPFGMRHHSESRSTWSSIATPTCTPSVMSCRWKWNAKPCRCRPPRSTRATTAWSPGRRA